MKLMEIYNRRDYGRSGWDTNTSGWQNREQSRMDSGRRAFKRDEMEAELGHEDRAPAGYPQRRPTAPAQQALGQFVISIAGRVWKKNGQPVTFSSEQRARSAAQTIRQRMLQRGENGDVDVLPTR